MIDLFVYALGFSAGVFNLYAASVQTPRKSPTTFLQLLMGIWMVLWCGYLLMALPSPMSMRLAL